MRIIDSHVHLRSAATGHNALYKLAGRLGYEKLALMSLQCYDPVQNMACALCKLQNIKNTYAFAGLDYVTGRDFRAQVENIFALGFDGVKMLEGKPTTRRLINRALDNTEYDGFYDFLEEKAFPVTLHVADPDTFWDAARAPHWAVEHGWLYNENDAPYEQYYTEVENMLRKHPKLKATFAHFFFLSWDAARAQRFLDEHPSVSIDITAGIEMYENFSKDPAFWREFFIKNQDRIIFGTDSSDEEPSEDAISLNGYAGMEIEFLSHSREIEIYGMKLNGIGLPEDARGKILAGNFAELVGNPPKKMDAAALIKEAEYMKGHLKKKDDIEKMDKIIDGLRAV